MKQQFVFNDNSKVELSVLAQMAYKYDAQTIQISKVKDPDTNELRFVYEEITNDTDEVVYARYMSEDNIRNNYPWAVTLLPCKPLTPKQKQLMQDIHTYMTEVDDDPMVKIENLTEYLTTVGMYTIKGVEGLLSSLWVKGYIRCNSLLGNGVRYFELEPFGVEYIKALEGGEQ